MLGLPCDCHHHPAISFVFYITPSLSAARLLIRTSLLSRPRTCIDAALHCMLGCSDLFFHRRHILPNRWVAIVMLIITSRSWSPASNCEPRWLHLQQLLPATFGSFLLLFVVLCQTYRRYRHLWCYEWFVVVVACSCDVCFQVLIPIVSVFLCRIWVKFVARR